MPDKLTSTFSEIERIASRDVGRGSETLATHTVGALQRAAVSVSRTDAPAVVILTGFFIPRATPPACETDGPLGAVQIASAIHALGGTARILTDEPCAPVIRAAIAAAGTAANLDIAPLPRDVGFEIFDAWTERMLLEYASVTHFISIERPGPSASGPPRNMRGLDISQETAPLDRCFSAGAWRKIAIGDGGNEIGMGVLPPLAVAQAVPLGEFIRCVVGCDDLLVGGTSNWAAAALVAGLAISAPARAERLLPLLDPSWSRHVLQQIVEVGGAVDGARLLPTPSVDGLDWFEYEAPLQDILRAATRALRPS